MWLIKLAWKNIGRNLNRSVITMAAIFFAVVLSVLTSSLKDGIFDNLVKNVVSFYTGYIQVHQKGYWEEQILDNSFEQSPSLEQRISRNTNITATSPRLESFALASSGSITKGCLVVGIDPEKENKITQLKSKLVQGDFLKEIDNGVLLSEGLADRLNLEAGDTIILIGQGYHGATAAGKYPVKGLIRFGAPDLNDNVLFLTLATAQYLYSAENRVTSLILSLKDTKKLMNTASLTAIGIGNDYEVMTWEEMAPEIKQHIQADSNNMRYIQGILYILICFGIFGTLLMMMVERQYEMGMLVAIGMKKNKLILLLLIESVFTVLAGCLAGILASIPLIFYLNRHPIRIGGETAEAYKRFGFEAIFPASTDITIFIYQGITVLLIGLAISLYPIYKVIRLNPVTAMKR